MRFWVCWYSPVVRVVEPAKTPDEGDLVERDSPEWQPPIVVRGEWVSGYRMSDDAATVVALIDAPSVDDINDALQGFETRFVEHRADDYTPGDRFPMPVT